MEIVEGKVKPERLKLGDNRDAQIRKRNWWHFGGYTGQGYSLPFVGWSECWCNSQVSQYLAFAFLPCRPGVYSHALNVFALSDLLPRFALLQSRVHEIWARFFASSMKDDLRYTPSDCFETFPFPEGFETTRPSKRSAKRTTSSAPP